MIRSATAVALVAWLGACGSDDTGSEADETDGPPPTTDAEITPPTTDAEVTPPTGAGDEPTEEDASELVVDLSESEAEAVIEERGWSMRVVKRDGEDLIVTQDFRPQRVNVEVTGDTVVGVEFIG